MQAPTAAGTATTLAAPAATIAVVDGAADAEGGASGVLNSRPCPPTDRGGGGGVGAAGGVGVCRGDG